MPRRKGTGRVQSAIIAALIRVPHQTTDELMHWVWHPKGAEITLLQRQSVYRALRTLAANKTIRTGKHFSGEGQPCWELIGSSRDRTRPAGSPRLVASG